MCEEMYFSLIRFSYMAVAGLFGDWNPFSRNSRFGSFNSRQAGVNSRLGRSRELGSQGLDSALPIFLPNGDREGENRRNSRFVGKKREPRAY